MVKKLVLGLVIVVVGSVLGLGAAAALLEQFADVCDALVVFLAAGVAVAHVAAIAAWWWLRPARLRVWSLCSALLVIGGLLWMFGAMSAWMAACAAGRTLLAGAHSIELVAGLWRRGRVLARLLPRIFRR